ncbi:autotransporter domain-containing protein [Methylophilaceae bacterium]|nr:autotransporter domain-containing protein [Methylophilaceae bacterium]
MNKIVYQSIWLAGLTITPLFSSQVMAGACPTGTDTAPTAGCTIGTSSTTYTMTGNMSPTDDAKGIVLSSDADSNTVTLTGNIRTNGSSTAESATALRLDTADNNTITITGDITTNGNQSHGIHFDGSDNTTVTMTGNISNDGSDCCYAGILYESSDNNTTILTGNITYNNAAGYGIFEYFSSGNTTTINGNIASDGLDAYSVYLYGSTNHTLIINGNITNITNHGINVNSSSGTSITNLGTITSKASAFDIYHAISCGEGCGSSSIATLNNKQSGLTYYGKVPTNYNIIIRGDTDYGQTTFSSVSSTMTFGIDLTNSGTNIGDKTYQDVLTGIAASGVLTATSGTSSGAAWALAHDGTNWDLTITGALSGSYYSGPSTASTLTSIQSAGYGVASQFSSYAMSTNYANLNTYDCGLFDQDGGCFSVGGRYSDVNGNNNSDSSSNALVAVGGFKINDHFRVAGFVDQQVNSNTPDGIKVDNKGPMLGMSLVWNQHADHLGYQVKVANAYQSKAITITRSATGDAEAGRGDTEVQVQSYVAEVSYQFSDGTKTSYRPYFALRRAIIKQNAYTETGVESPLTFNTLEDKSTTVIMGMKSKYKLNDKVTLNGALGVEHDISNNVDKMQATSSTITGLTPVDLNTSVNKTRPVATLGATYYISPNQSFSAQTQYQELSYTSTSAKTAYFNYSVGF